MLGFPLAFAAPAVLAALIGLVGLYFLLRVTPPSPRQATFPPLRLLIGLDPNETTPARTPWPILALRLAIGALIILAMAEPLWNGFVAFSGSRPLLVLVDDGFAAAPAWDKRMDFARERATAAARSGRIVGVHAFSQGGQDLSQVSGQLWNWSISIDGQILGWEVTGEVTRDGGLILTGDLQFPGAPGWRWTVSRWETQLISPYEMRGQWVQDETSPADDGRHWEYELVALTNRYPGGRP